MAGAGQAVHHHAHVIDLVDRGGEPDVYVIGSVRMLPGNVQVAEVPKQHESTDVGVGVFSKNGLVVR